MIGQQFKTGDKVQLIEDYGTRRNGDKGTVTKVTDTLVYVRMDKQNQYGSWEIDCYARRLKKAIPDVPVPRAPLPDAIYLVAQSADRIFPRRSYDTILKSLMEEMGELSTEIAIEQGTKKRAPSSDGVKGEAVDVFVVAVDMLRAAWGDDLFSHEFTDKVASKLAKWEGVK